MKKIRLGTSKRKELIVKDYLSPNSRSQSIPQQSLSLQITARTLIKKFHSLKSLKASDKNQSKVLKVYKSLLALVHQVLADTFDQEVCRELIQMLNRLVYVYQSEDSQFSPQESEASKKQVALKNFNGSLEQIQTSRQGVIELSSHLSTPCNIMSKLNSKRSQNDEPEGKEVKHQRQFRFLLYQKLKCEFKKVKQEKRKLNAEIMLINQRISGAFQQVEQRIRETDLKKIVQGNKSKLKSREGKENKDGHQKREERKFQ